MIEGLKKKTWIKGEEETWRARRDEKQVLRKQIIKVSEEWDGMGWKGRKERVKEGEGG